MLALRCPDQNLAQDALEPQQQQHSPALDQLQRALFGVQHELTFMELVYSSTFERVQGPSTVT